MYWLVTVVHCLMNGAEKFCHITRVLFDTLLLSGQQRIQD